MLPPIPTPPVTVRAPVVGDPDCCGLKNVTLPNWTVLPITERLPPIKVFPVMYVLPPIPTPPVTVNAPVVADPDCCGLKIVTLPNWTVFPRTQRLPPTKVFPEI